MKKITELDEYQRIAMDTLYYFGSKKKQLEYAVLALCGESGELANTLKKVVYYGDSSVKKKNIINELSDVLWYVACVANALDLKLSDVATYSVNKVLAKQGVADKGCKYANKENCDGDCRCCRLWKPKGWVEWMRWPESRWE